MRENREETRGFSAAPGRAFRVRVGDRVEHSEFGSGTVMSIDGEGGQLKLTILFDAYGLKKVLTQYASLKRR